MTRRILTAIPLALFVSWLIIQNREWPFILALLVTVEIGVNEFYAVGRNAGLKSLPWLGYIGALVVLTAQVARLHRVISSIALLLILLLFAVPAAGLLSSRIRKTFVGTIATTCLGITYVALTLSCLIPLRFSDRHAGLALTLLLFFVIWGSDIAAYFVGRSIGRTFPYPRLSPKKTVEGSVAGLLAAMAIGWLFVRFYWKSEPWTLVALWALVVAVAGQAGDLLESAMKRRANMKDSGSLLPGHGGMLDRIDSLLFGTPILWLVWELRGIWR